MKKIYERPVVELTVFDTEDIMTVSELSTTDSDNADKLVEEYTVRSKNAVWGNYKSGTYNWK